MPDPLVLPRSPRRRGAVARSDTWWGRAFVRSFEELALRTGDFAQSMAAVVLRRESGIVVDARVGVGAVTDRPTRLPDVEALLVGSSGDDAAADAGDDLLDHPSQLLLRAEARGRERQLAGALDEDHVGTVDHDVRDLAVGQKLLQWAETEQLVDEHLFERELFAAVERQLELGEHLADDWAELLGELVLAHLEGQESIERHRVHHPGPPSSAARAWAHSCMIRSMSSRTPSVISTGG